jgi:hypothetical protein
MKTEQQPSAIPLGLVPHEEIPNMWRLIWSDGVLSKDYYNLPRAKNHLAVLKENKQRNQYRRVRISPEKAVDAFKS